MKVTSARFADLRGLYLEGESVGGRLTAPRDDTIHKLDRRNSFEAIPLQQFMCSLTFTTVPWYHGITCRVGLPGIRNAMDKQSLANFALRQLARRPHIEGANKLPGHLAGDLYSLCQEQASPSSALSLLSSEGFRPSHLSLTSLAITDRHLQMLSGLADDLVELRLTKCSLEGGSTGLVRTFPHIERLFIEDLLDRTDCIHRLLVACATASQVHLSSIRGSSPLGVCPFNQLVKLELKGVPIKDGGALRTWLLKHQQSLIHLSLQALCDEEEEELRIWRPFFSCRFPHLRFLHIQSRFVLLNLQPALMKRLRIVCPQLLMYINGSDPACPAVVKWPLIIGTKSRRYHLAVTPRELPSIYKEYYVRLAGLL